MKKNPSKSYDFDGFWSEWGDSNSRHLAPKSAEQGNEYADFFLEHFDQVRRPNVFLAATRLLHHLSQIFRDNSVPPAAPVGQRVDRKLRRKIQKKKIAMGHKPDDHEEAPRQDMGGMTMGW